MRRPRLTPESLAAVSALVVLGAMAVLTAPGKTPPVDVYASDDYHAGGYRAWADLLSREGVATQRFVLRAIELDDRIDTLISAQPAGAPLRADDARTAADLGALGAWVRRGGRLVYLGRNAGLADAEKRLLDLPLVRPDVGARGRLRGAAAGTVRSLDGLGSDRMVLVHPGTALLADGNGGIVARYPLGRGEIVAVVDPRLFTNARIAAGDNARLAFIIGRPGRAAGRVAFDDGLHGALVDRPWYRALPVPVRVSLGIGAVALLLGLVGSALRSSPPMSVRAVREPSSAEFIDALAALYERTRARAAVRSILALDALAAAARAAGLPDDVAPATLVARLGDRPAAAPVRRLVALLDARVVTDADLIAGAQLAYLVRKESDDDGTGYRGRAAFASRARPNRRR